MTAWKVRGGGREEEELKDGVVAIGFGVGDMSHVQTREDAKRLMEELYPDATPGSINSRTFSVWTFKGKIKTGDLVVMPRKGKPIIAIGDITGEYRYDPRWSDLPHRREVKWINREIQINALDLDLQKSISAENTVSQVRSENAEQRLRAIAESGRNIQADAANDGDARWDTFIGWAKRFYEWDQFYEMERGYKLQVGQKLAAVKQALRDDDPDWENLLRTTFRDPDSNNLVHWRTLDNFLKLDPAQKEKTLRYIWGIDTPTSLEDRVRGFHELSPFGTAGEMVSFLLMADGAQQFPMYRYTPLRVAYQLTGYPSAPNNSPDAWVRYKHALDFWDEFIKQASSRSLQIKDRLDAQGLVWCVTHYGTDNMPANWAKDVKDQLIAYRVGDTSDVPLPSLTAEADPWSEPNITALAEELMWQPKYLRKIIVGLKYKRQMIFHGPPGTGKTYVASRIAEHCREHDGDFQLVQFHPSYSYEDFIEGFRPKLFDDRQPGFKLTPGPLRRIARQAQEKPDSTFIMVIDELNRGNVAKVFGELYFLLEYRNNKMRLQYGEEEFSLPPNLWFICTMNTADRSIALMDGALRRRFRFFPFFPDKPPIEGLLRQWLKKDKRDMEWVADLVDMANQNLERHTCIGPSYFMAAGDALDEDLVRDIWEGEVIPYIEEQFFGDEDKLAEFAFDRLKRQLAGSSSESEELTPETTTGLADDAIVDSP